MKAIKDKMLIIFGGLPGNGKTTIAKILAQKLKAVYIRIDSIEQALIQSGIDKQQINASGYEVGYALVAENLRLNMPVIADSVNPLEITREAWRNVGLENDSQFFEVEIVCSDKAEHRKRIKSRVSDIHNHKLPSWEDVLQREYDPWLQDHLVIDTAKISALDAANMIIGKIN
ncbi:MAG: putative kinase [Gammaproteobacteria bacterium]|jgi:predicted kinase|nr:putative kinase [Gammaproteobacteria bacterium]